ncbi:hypothetical protein PG996_015837 [Apiospora saccharicola]|uniref:DUF6594 domain-containing protein n=1 Tax=Apiospora saccharicola TaxID=335842 RepID=A0ABR1TM79_9PEZI
MANANQSTGSPLARLDGDNYVLFPTPKKQGVQPQNLDEFSVLYSDEDLIAQACTGPSWIAARAKYYPNEDIHRGFGYLSKRVLLDIAQRLGCLELELLRLEQKEDEETLCQYAFDRDAFVANCSGLPFPAADDSQPPSQDEADRRQRMVVRENLLHHIKMLKKEYSDREIQTMPQISHEQQYAVYERIANNRILTPSALQYLLNTDDFITPNPDLVHQRFEWLLYTTRPYLWKTIAFFRRGFCSLCSHFKIPTPPVPGGENENPEHDYDARVLKWLSRFVLAPTVAIFLLVPVAILFFGHLTKAAEFGVVLAFVALFVLTISCFERSTVKIIIGVCAFEAVLAAFLAK